MRLFNPGPRSQVQRLTWEMRVAMVATWMFLAYLGWLQECQPGLNSDPEHHQELRSGDRLLTPVD
jgi:hypothetical protein